MCEYSNYEINRVSDSLKDENLLLYSVKYSFFYIKIKLDHFFGAKHTHHLNDYQEWAVSPWETLLRDIWEIVLLFIIAVLLAYLCYFLSSNLITFKNFCCKSWYIMKQRQSLLKKAKCE